MLLSVSPPESLLSSLSNSDLKDDSIVHNTGHLIKTVLPWNKVVIGKGGLETRTGEGDLEMGGRMEEGLPGPDFTTVTKWSDSEPVPESGHW